MINVDSDMKGLADYVGSVGGVLQAVEDPRFEGDFVEHMMDSVSNSFYVETIAAKNAGSARVAHVFEWGMSEGDVSDLPLFRLTRSGARGHRGLGYMFMPSTRHVPLPNPSKYGFDPAKLQYLRRHVFQLKALVMETKANVRVSPVGAKKLFIPSKDAERGYVMTHKTTNINPGGKASTGGFATWWNEWFAMRAQAIVSTEVQQTEKWLIATGARYVRYAAGTSIGGRKVGGQFASGRAVSATYVDAKARSVKARVLAESKVLFDEDKYWETWD